MRLIPLTICFTVGLAITSGAHIAPIRSGRMPDAPPQTTTITATFTTDGLTLSLTSRCEPAERVCSFRAEIQAPRPLFDLISQVEYTNSPEHRGVRSPVTDSSSRFRFEGRQIVGELVYAEVTLKRRGSASTEVVLLQGSVPFSAAVIPQPPNGLRFEDQYQPWYLEGGAGNYQYFRIRLRGEPSALKAIRSVEYQLPQSHFSRAKFLAKAFEEYLIGDTVSGGARFEIVAVIRWKSDARSSHVISVRAP